MKSTYAIFIIVLGLVGLLVTGPLQAGGVPDCQDDAKSGSVCLMKVEDLHPTQFSVGGIAVDCKSKKIEKKYKKGKLDGYLADEKRHIPAAIGPDGRFYITDHHHLSTAVYRAKKGSWNGKKQKVHINILVNFTTTGISMHEFWNRMEVWKNVWRFDENGKNVKDYEDKLPKMDMGDLKDNPYRTLSRWTRESCGYIKKGKDQCIPLEASAGEPTAPNFMEFYWARFLREQLKVDNDELNTPIKVKNHYKEAIKVTLDKEKTSAFFKAQHINAIDYGQNQEGTYLHLEFKGNACEQWWMDAGDGA